MTKRWFSSFNNHLMEKYRTVTPTVGMGCTIIMRSDRYAGTVVEIKSPSRIKVQEDTMNRTDTDGMSDCQSYDHERDPNGATYIFTKRRDGRWKEHKGTNGLCLNVRDAHRDFSF